MRICVCSSGVIRAACLRGVPFTTCEQGSAQERQALKNSKYSSSDSSDDLSDSSSSDSDSSLSSSGGRGGRRGSGGFGKANPFLTAVEERSAAGSGEGDYSNEEGARWAPGRAYRRTARGRSGLPQLSSSSSPPPPRGRVGGAEKGGGGGRGRAGVGARSARSAYFPELSAKLRREVAREVSWRFRLAASE